MHQFAMFQTTINTSGHRCQDVRPPAVLPWRSHWEHTAYRSLDAQNDACQRLRDFVPLNESFPATLLNGAHAAIDAMLPDVRGKSYIQIGDRVGDMARCMQHYAAEVRVVEADAQVCARLRSRGLSVFCGWVGAPEVARKKGFSSSEGVPVADVYYWWTWPRYYKTMLRAVHAAATAKGRSAVVFIGSCQNCWHEARAFDLHTLCATYGDMFGPERVSLIRVVLPWTQRVLNSGLVASARGRSKRQHWYLLRVEVGAGVRTRGGIRRRGMDD